MSLPPLASGAFNLQDVRTGLTVTVALRDTTGASVEVSDGYLVYPAAYEGGADLINRPYPSGTEQSIAFATKPAAEQVTYDVALGAGVAGVRLMANTVEFLDGQGAPRLRMAPPFIAGGQSTGAWPRVSVAGCTTDTNPAPPWGRAVVAPASTRCAVTVDWSQSGIQYPALLDPTWSVGSTMAVARMHHGGARVTASGKELALVFGGYAFTSTVASAELFDETSGTWAQTGGLVAGVAYPAAVALANGTALALGGFQITGAGGSETDDVQAYDPTSGTWSLQGHLGSAREEHTATLLGSGNVLVAGGFGAYPQVFAAALLYNPSTGAATAAGAMQSGRGDHSATLLTSGKVLVLDGMTGSATPASAADLYDPSANTWSVAPAPPLAARFSHVAPLLTSGKVLFAGGEDPASGITGTLSTAIYDPTANTWSIGPPTVGSHYLGTAITLGQGANAGKVLLGGGDFALDGVELFDPTALTWTPVAPLLTGRDGHVAVSLQSGVLFAGGSDGNGDLLSSAELYQPDVAAASPQWPSGSAVTVAANGPPTSVTLSWSAASDPNGVSGYNVYQNGQLVGSVSGSTFTDTVSNLPPGAQLTFAVQAVDPGGAPTWTGPTVPYLVVPPSASMVASAIDRTVSTQVSGATSFLYTGANAIQQGLDAGAIAPTTATVVRGYITTTAGSPLPGVSVTVANHPELGQTYTQANGEYDLAANGGEVLRLQFALSGYLSADRTVQAPWKDYVMPDALVMIQTDSQVTPVTLSSSTTSMQVARGNPSSDSSGTRQATVLVPPATTGSLLMPDGSTSPLTMMHVRATEFTVGSSGTAAMPAALPPSSVYTYALSLSADEELAAGATRLTFSQPVYFYFENFLGFAVGTSVPNGYYDPTLGSWVPSANGVVMKILSVTGGTATVDTTGSGHADNASALAALGITTMELQTLASLYTAGQTVCRMPIAHFTNYDPNMGPGPPPGSAPPGGPGPAPPPGPGPGPCKDTNASTIRCQVQSLGEDLAIAGTPYVLHYESDRQRGRLPALNVPLSGATLPGPVQSISMEVRVGGRVFDQTFDQTSLSPSQQANQITTFSWDGLDAYGRLLQGGQPITVQVGNVYQGVYQNVDTFGLNGNGTSLSVNMRGQDTISRSWTGIISLWDAKPAGLGGWDLDIHHSFDIPGQTLRFGNGDDITPLDVPATVQTVAGNGQGTVPNGDGGQATQASVEPEAVAIGPDGNLYIADGQSCIRRVTPDGIINTFAGQCNSTGFSGDGGPATSALLHEPEDIAFGPDGSLYIADALNNRIRRVYPSGVIQTVAGSGKSGTAGSFTGDGKPAVQATLNDPWGVDVAVDGTIYIADLDNARVRRVGPDGTISTMAGDGTGSCSCGTDGLATQAPLDSPIKVRVGRDGSVYVAEFNGSVIRRIGTDGIIRAFVGPGPLQYGGDGGAATGASIFLPEDMALAPDGSLYLVDENCTVRKVDTTGVISTLAGNPANCSYGGDGGLAATATLSNAHGIRVSPDGSIYIAGSADNRVRKVQAVLTGFSTGTNEYQFPSSDGRQVYLFDGAGRHLQTLDAFTKATIYQFGYDGGRLASVTDVAGNVTQINHDGAGNLTSIVGPFGNVTTTFVPDGNGYIAKATDPANQATQFTYDAKGLMLTRTGPRGGLSQYSYDSFGRLTEDQDPAGGSKTLSRSDSSTASTVTSTTALGRTTTYVTATEGDGTFTRQNTMASGLQSSLQFSPTSVTTITQPDGTTTATAESADPRVGFGMLAPVPTVTTTTPSGLTSTSTTTRAATYSGADLATFTEQNNLNGNTWTSAFDATAQTWTSTSPMGRTVVTTLDAAGRPTQIAVPNVTPTTFVYDAHGRLSTTTQGSNILTRAYDPQGYLASVTDSLSHATSFTNDPIGRATQTQFADGRFLHATYDGDNNTTGITLPAPESHAFSYTPVDLLASYTPPSLGSGSPATQYVYDVDRELKTVTRPDGVTLTYGYDSAGRLITTSYPQGTLTFGYDATTGKLTSKSAASGEGLQYVYDGFLKTGATWTGPVPGTLSWGFDNNFRVTSQTVNGTALAFGYDLDGLLTGAGALTLSLDQQNGHLNGTTLGSMTDAYTYDASGLFATYTAKYNGTPLYVESVTRDAIGRITQKTETVQGVTHVWGYTFDAAARLTDVTEDGSFFSHYGYDADDNRTTYQNTSGPLSPSPTYDAQDRLVTYGGNSYGYTADGELTSKTVGGQTTSYTYDALGNLLHVAPPSGSAIDYVIDGENRRVGKKLAGTLTTGYLYQDSLNVVVQLDGSGNVVSRFVFGSKPNVPDYYTTSAGTFRILSDHLGSPRLVVNASTGAVVEEIDYDEFGVVTKDTAPGTIPFGFAGGLYDKDTGLVRFGARDYDATTGRWTAKDPLRFDGGQVNLFVYANNDPLNQTDRGGLACENEAGQAAAACAAAAATAAACALATGSTCGAAAACWATATAAAAACGLTLQALATCRDNDAKDNAANNYCKSQGFQGAVKRVDGTYLCQ